MRKATINDSLKQLRSSGLVFTDVIDVGIQHSTPVLIENFGDVQHHLFEPVEEYFPFIKENYKELSYNLTCAAVCNYDGNSSLQTVKKTRGDEVSHSFMIMTPTETSRLVPAITLDSYCLKKELSGEFFLKIDVEGPDVPSAILEGAATTLKKTNAVMIEMTVDKFVERAHLLHEAGFDLWDLCDLCYYGNCLWQADAVFIKRDLKKTIDSLAPIHAEKFDPDHWQSGF
ncbi:MAG: FkbM family methyltransferase [Pseudomonadales bacterium]|nr:FkbM family methyltransferase [Pseudomonadales bacterium]